MFTQKVIVLLIISIIIQSFSFLSMKIAATYEAYQIIALSLALLFFAIRAFLWQLLLKIIPLSSIYPFTSFVQVFILIYAIFIFHEEVILYQLLGILFMILGLYIMFTKDSSSY